MVNFYFSRVGNGECAGIGDSYILRTDGQTDRQTDRVRRIMRPPPREEGRIINGDGDCRRQQPKTGGFTAQVRWLGLRVGGRLALLYIHQMNRVSSCNDLGHDDGSHSTINIVMVIIIIIVITLIGITVCCS